MVDFTGRWLPTEVPLHLYSTYGGLFRIQSFPPPGARANSQLQGYLVLVKLPNSDTANKRQGTYSLTGVAIPFWYFLEIVLTNLFSDSPPEDLVITSYRYYNCILRFMFLSKILNL